MDVDTNDGSVNPNLLTYQLNHNSAAAPLTLSCSHNENRNWDLSDNGDDPSGGVHVYVSNSIDGSGLVVVHLRLVANPDAIIKGAFSTTYTWTFTISGFGSTHDLDIITTALDSSGIAIIPNPVSLHIEGNKQRCL